MTDYDAYLYSGKVHYISNSGSDENGRTHGGRAGDQTGGEWRLRSWYRRPWSVVLRHPDPDVRLAIAKKAVDAALNDHVGYDQYQRLSYWRQLEAAGYEPSRIQTDCEADCTAGVAANIRAAGLQMGVRALAEVSCDLYSGNMRRALEKAGFAALTDARYTSSADALLPGDILLLEGHHAATNITRGRSAQEETTRLLRRGASGADVRALQTQLIALGFDCGPDGPDGEFGKWTEQAVRAFQRAYGCEADGEVGPETRAALEKAARLIERIRIAGGDCFIRAEPDARAQTLGVAHEGEALPYGGEARGGWLRTRHRGQVAWVSGRFAQIEQTGNDEGGK